ncbi:hypothetical protein AN958_08220 [Leucoagaricus sp. SymC.cos]|nr:hypothetical protein AN958_08220 [Leucoagaricus sp. SymC.cos]
MSVTPGLGLAFSLLTKALESIKNVKVYRCVELLVTLQESGDGLEGNTSTTIIDEIEALVRQVESKAQEWSEYNHLKSFLLQGEIQEGLEELDRKIETINMKYSFKMSSEAARINYEIYNAHKSAQMEIRDLLAQLVKDVEKLLREESSTNPVVEEVMQGLQTELRADDLQPEHEETFKKGLWMLHQRTRKLPPLTDLLRRSPERNASSTTDSQSPAFRPTRRVRTNPGGKDSISGLFRGDDEGDQFKPSRRHAFKSVKGPAVKTALVNSSETLCSDLLLTPCSYPTSPSTSFPNTHVMSVTPGLGLAFSLLTKALESIKNVKVYRVCVELLVTLQESGDGLEGNTSTTIIDEIEALVRQVESKAQEWSEYNHLKSFLLQGEIQEGLEELDRKIETINMKYSFKMSSEAARINYEIYNAHKSAQMEIRDLLAQLVKDVEKLLREESSTNPVVEEVMQGLQTELRADDLQPEHEETFKKGLWMLHQRTRKLPPLTDLTGQVEMTSRHRVAAGTHNDVYTGLWLGKEKVALRLPRLPPGDHGVHKRFERDLTIWRNNDHLNVVPLYGVFYQGSDVYSVSPWMDNGTVIDYLEKHPSIDRLAIISGITRGLEYLHRKGVIHGDLRAGNVLINRDGVACLSDFGMSKMLEDASIFKVDRRGSTTSPNHNPRWCAPELLEPNISVSKKSDIWSFGMACLEILTGDPPYATVKNHLAVYGLVQAGKLPDRPAYSRISDALWSLFEKCWRKEPDSRPTISEVRRHLAIILNPPSASKSPTDVPKTSRTPTASLSKVDMHKSGSILGFIKPDKRRNSISSSVSSLIGHVRPLVEEPKPMTPDDSSSSTRSPAQAPRLEVTFETGEEEWDFAPQPGTTIPYNTLDLTTGSPVAAISPITLPSALAEHLPPRSTRSSDASSNYSASTRAAVTDSSIVINSLRDGTVASGTLEGLIERLINGFGRPRDKEFREILLSSTVDFVTAEEFFGVIERRFHEADRVAFPQPEDRVRIQLNILAALKYWVKTPHLPLEPQLVWQMRNFCENAKRRTNGLTMKKKADRVILALNHDIRAASLPLPVQGPPLTADDVRPVDLAIGLTLLESDKYKQIYPSDYLLHLGGRQTSVAIEAVGGISLKLMRWAQKIMLYYDKVLERTKMMTFFLNTAKECLSLHNFSSAAAIATAFNSREIRDLEYSQDQLESSMRDFLRKLRALVGGDRRVYHAAWAKVSRTPNDRIPWLTVHLHDLGAILNEHPTTYEAGGHTLINFERYMHFRKYLDEHISPSRDAYADLNEQYRDKGQLAYVLAKLNNVDLHDKEANEALERMALERKLDDQRAKRNWSIEKAKLGFGTSSRKKSS